MIDHGYRILLFKGTGVVSAMIGWQTRSEYTHAALLCPNGDVIEAWEGSGNRLWRNSGVRVTTLRTDVVIVAFDVPTATLSQWRTVEKFMRSQVGNPYDFSAVFRFLSRRSYIDNEAWFCSEILFMAFRLVGIRLLNQISAWAVSPGHISISPILKERTIPDYLL